MLAYVFVPGLWCLRAWVRAAWNRCLHPGTRSPNRGRRRCSGGERQCPLVAEAGVAGCCGSDRRRRRMRWGSGAGSLHRRHQYQHYSLPLRNGRHYCGRCWRCCRRVEGKKEERSSGRVELRKGEECEGRMKGMVANLGKESMMTGMCRSNG